ncbi:dynein light chain 4, axonemal-like isoform X1 [Anguilla anguilla]|uniref:dynein light chain 4, axonemal-like isoform X1 n=1 Tax=Anguilla anguilla TaxID=7936 RepID=UPI0015A9B581|nr:dynein light chain 4, axonemal-like isoform X1 [Anguilla anguilla]
MAETVDSKKDEPDYKRLHSFPLIRHTDMPEEMRVEAMELCVTACEKFTTNNESAAKMIKESMDKKFGSSWHVVIGEGFGFEITHEGSISVVVNVAVVIHACVHHSPTLQKRRTRTQCHGNVHDLPKQSFSSLIGSMMSPLCTISIWKVCHLCIYFGNL